MLGKRRRILINGDEVAKTPLLLPSFSSKISSPARVKDILKFAEGVITEGVLVSAYDVSYQEIPKDFSFASVVFLDSGGYEVSEDADLSAVGKGLHRPRNWNQKLHREVLRRWDFATPTVIVSYDHPRSRISIRKQLVRASNLFPDYRAAGKEILLKTEASGEEYLEFKNVLPIVNKLRAFDIVGFTEKELGASTLQRMTNIAKVRMELTRLGLDIPIHIFGSLDPVSTPLYFFAGADIFDGLTWLRYTYKNGCAIYKHNYGALDLGIKTEDYKVDAQSWNHNYYYMMELQNEMQRFLVTGDFTCFSHHAEFFRKQVETLKAELGD